MIKAELKSYLFRNGWRDSKWIPDSYKGKSIVYKNWVDEGKPESGIYEKVSDGVIPFKRIKLLKTSMRLEIRGVTGWKKAELIYYKDLRLDSKTDRLYKLHNGDIKTC